jgi:hypothetical protein
MCTLTLLGPSHCQCQWQSGVRLSTNLVCGPCDTRGVHRGTLKGNERQNWIIAAAGGKVSLNPQCDFVLHWPLAALNLRAKYDPMIESSEHAASSPFRSGQGRDPGRQAE